MVLVAYSTDLGNAFCCMGANEYSNICILSGFIEKESNLQMKLHLKYFLFGALSSAIIVYGISIAYGLTGSTNIGEVIQGYSTSRSQSLFHLHYLSIGMFIAGFGFKMGLVPFHQWLPDTYEGAPPTITTLLAAGTKKVGFAASSLELLFLEW